MFPQYGTATNCFQLSHSRRNFSPSVSPVCDKCRIKYVVARLSSRSKDRVRTKTCPLFVIVKPSIWCKTIPQCDSGSKGVSSMREAGRAIIGFMVLLLCVGYSSAAVGDRRLVEAVKNGDNAMIRSLLEQHVDVNVP